MTHRPALMVLGATSLIGRALRRLGDRPPLICVSRHQADDLAQGDRWTQADLAAGDLADQLAPAAGVETALGLAPIWVVAPAVPALAALGVRRIVAFSSTSRWTKSASADPGERALAERLAAAEAAFIAACDQSAVAWTVLRPTLIYDEGRDRNVTRLAGLIRRLGVLPLSGCGEGRRQPVHAEDLALGALSALVSPLTHGRAYDLPGGETLTYREMTTRIFAALDRPPRLLHLHPALWRLGFSLAGVFLPGATAAMGTRMGADLVFDASDAARDFSWRPRPFWPRFPA